ncbi:hypothetical protein G4O51_13175 [Candidatus Bathyarchaeota archaeon A05DMB-2]|jgi:hypothetical protein|nr:hypothetical protein [Candidatus Bathyarchaeota archaeon A05DMB-2]
MTKIKKVAVIHARLVENPEAYEGKTNADIEKEILAEIGIIPYVAQIEKVTVLDRQLQRLHALDTDPPVERTNLE